MEIQRDEVACQIIGLELTELNSQVYLTSGSLTTYIFCLDSSPHSSPGFLCSPPFSCHHRMSENGHPCQGTGHTAPRRLYLCSESQGDLCTPPPRIPLWPLSWLPQAIRLACSQETLFFTLGSSSRRAQMLDFEVLLMSQTLATLLPHECKALLLCLIQTLLT